MHSITLKTRMTSSPSAKKHQAPVVLAMPGNEQLAGRLTQQMQANLGEWTFHRFPDGESLVQVHTDLGNRQVIILCTLHEPDLQFLPLYFLAQTCRELGAAHLCLLAPYLAYMRQDKRFHPGEAITSVLFARLLSQTFNSIVTVDPHLHRWKSLQDIYTNQTCVIHAAETIAAWIGSNIDQPLLVGPDSESEQWVREVAKLAGCPYLVLEKIRHGDQDVQISLPAVEKYMSLTPVLLDDIISTARTMAVTVRHLRRLGLRAPVCIGVHAVFTRDAFEVLKSAGAAMIVTCNTIAHPTNAIDLTGCFADAVKRIIEG